MSEEVKKEVIDAVENNIKELKEEKKKLQPVDSGEEIKVFDILVENNPMKPVLSPICEYQDIITKEIKIFTDGVYFSSFLITFQTYKSLVSNVSYNKLNFKLATNGKKLPSFVNTLMAKMTAEECYQEVKKGKDISKLINNFLNIKDCLDYK